MRHNGWIIASLVGVAALAGTAPGFEYRVRSGDSLARIAQRFGVSIEDIRAANGIQDADLILVGDVLEIPDDSDEAEPEVHVVRSGESLWMIALKYRVTTADLRRANGLRTDVLQPGQRLRLAGSGAAVAAVEPDEPSAPAPQPVAGVSAAELEILARIVKGECPHDVPWEGKVAVAAVVINRTTARGFPGTIRGVAHQPMQFSCYNRNVRQRLYMGRIPQWAWDAARAAVAGQDPTNGSTHYFNPHLVRPSWARTLRFVRRIGTTPSTTHDFYKPR